MATTAISWVLNPDGTAGEGWPVTTGCSPIHAGCRDCWAARLAATRLREIPIYEGLAERHDGYAHWTGHARFNKDLLSQPARWRKPRTVLISPTGDLFHQDITNAQREDVLQVIRENPRHFFLMLTKRYYPLKSFFAVRNRNLPDNLAVGVSIDGTARTVDNGASALASVPARIKYVSLEPLLADVAPALKPHLFYIDLIIVGGETGPRARPMHANWARRLLWLARHERTMFYFKQWGSWRPWTIFDPVPEDISRLPIYPGLEWHGAKVIRAHSDIQPGHAGLDTMVRTTPQERRRHNSNDLDGIMHTALPWGPQWR